MIETRRLHPALLGLFALLTLLAVTLAGLQWARGWQLDTDLQSLLPQDPQQQLLNHAVQRLSDTLGDRLLLAVSADDASTARAAATVLEPLLAASPLLAIAAVDDSQAHTETLDLLKQYHFNLLTDAQRQRIAARDDATLQRQAGAALFGLALDNSALSPLQDPLALFPAYAAQLSPPLQGELHNGHLLVTDAQGAMLLFFLQLRADALRLDTHDQLNALLDTLQQTLSQQQIGPVQLLRSGAPFHAAEASANARREIAIIGLGSSTGILLLFLLAFRRALPLALSLGSALFGCLIAFIISHAWYGSLHLITLVFGAGLIGVAVDHALHYISHHQQLGPRASGRGVLGHMLPMLTLGLLTSMLAYACLFQTGLWILQQIAVFSLIGLFSAWLFVVALYPLLLRAPLRPAPAWLTRVATLPARALQASGRPTALLWLLPPLALAALYGSDFDPDVRLLYRPSPALAHSEWQLGQRLQAVSPSQFFLVQAQSAEALLQAEERFRAHALDPLRERGALEDYMATSRFVPSIARQRDNHALLQRVVYGEDGLALRFMRTAGFAAEDMQPLRQRFAAAGEHFLETPDWLRVAPAEYRILWLGEHGGRHASIIALRGIGDVEALVAAAAEDEAVQWVDRIGALSQLLAQLTQRAALFLGVTYLAIGALLWLWFRRARAIALILPPMAATVATLSLMVFLGQQPGLFHILGCYLVLGLGMDYSIFLQHSRHLDPGCLRAILLSALTSGLSFGLLALSSTPMVSAFGFVLLLGSLFNWLLAPLLHTQRAR